MVTEDASNLKVIGIKGNFDDAQAALKQLLGSDSFKQTLKDNNVQLSAANSVNFGRIVFQIIYHIDAYLELVRRDEIALGDPIYLAVPSGNFGNALGGYYALRAGLPVEKVLIASNNNNVLTGLIKEGRYDFRGSELIQTVSPAMDIQKASNVERVLFDLFGAKRTKELMAELDKTRCYALSDAEHTELKRFFAADFCDDTETVAYIRQCHEEGYLSDPHTATCIKVYDNCREQPLKTVVTSTAEWTKFSMTMASALGYAECEADLQALDAVSSNAGVSIPKQIAELFDKPIAHKTVIDKSEIEQSILEFI